MICRLRLPAATLLTILTLSCRSSFAASSPSTCADLHPALSAAAAIIKQRYVLPAEGRAAAKVIELEAAEGIVRHVCGNGDDQALRLTMLLRSALPDWHLRVAAGAPPAEDPTSKQVAVPTPDDHGVVEVIRMPGGIGYLRISQFDDITAAVSRLSAAMMLLSDVRGVILDVRGNRGGDARTMDLVLRSFLPPGAPETMVKLDRAGRAVAYAPPEAAWRGFSPMVKAIVIVDRASASAAEALAFGLREEVGAIVIGNRSLGAAHEIDSAEALPGGFALFVPEFRLVGRKSGRDWEQTGVIPDIEADGPDAPLLAWEALRKSPF